jgi:hypothetical protein
MDQQDVGRTDPSPSAGWVADPSIATLSVAAGLAVDVAAAALAAVGEGLRRMGSEARTVSDEESSEEQVVESAELVDAVGHAVVGVGAAVAQVTLATAFAGFRGFERAASAVLRQPAVQEPVDRLIAATGTWEGRGREALDVDAQSAIDAGLDLVAEIAVLVIDRLDLDAVVDRVNIDRAAARLDVEQLVRRLDLTRITQGVIDQLDLTAIAQRVLDELDLTEIARRVIDELELTELIRESTTTVSVDTVDAIRVGGMTADRALARLVGRLLMRKNGSAPDGDGGPSDPATS